MLIVVNFEEGILVAILTPPAGYLQPFGRFGGTHTFYLAFSGTTWLPCFFSGTIWQRCGIRPTRFSEQPGYNKTRTPT